MAARSISETKRLRYLLGLSSLGERAHIELEYFENEDAFQEMLTAEDDLIDAYARDELADEERRRFEKHFVSSSHGRDRIQFARAFAGALSATRSVQTKRPSKLLYIFRTFQSPGLVRTSTIAAMIVFVTGLAWLVIDRQRMTNELRELHAESVEFRKRSEALQLSSDTERTPTPEIPAQLADLGAQPNKPSHRERGQTATRRARHLPQVKSDREKIASSRVEKAEKVINTEDASLGNAFQTRDITELPVLRRNFENLLTLPRATPSHGVGVGYRTDQANITLDGVSLEPLNTYVLMPRSRSGSAETTIRIPSSLRWIRFRIELETAAIHEDYRITIKTTDGRPVTSVNWIEPLTPNQSIIDTPVILTGDLPSGDYVLLLMGKEPAGSFVKVAEYSFKVINYQ